MGIRQVAALVALTCLLSSCADDMAGDQEVAAYNGIAADETITLVGNEPFWNMVIDGHTLTYTTPENMAGSVASVTRFAGNNGLGFSGTLEGEALQVAVTPGTCSDTMSDRSYPFTATVTLGDLSLTGCGYTDAQPFVDETSVEEEPLDE